MISSCCPEKRKPRSGKQVTGEREPHAINWECGRRLGQGLVLPIFGLFNMHLANSLTSGAGLVILPFEREPSQAAFELHQDSHRLPTWVSVCRRESTQCQEGRCITTTPRRLTSRGPSNPKPKCPCTWHDIAN